MYRYDVDVVMIANKLSEEYKALLTAFFLHFFVLADLFITVLNFKVNLFVAKIFVLIFECYYLPAYDKVDIIPRKRVQIVARQKYSNLNVSKSNVGRIF